MLAGCEIIADFDSGDEVEGRTIPPTPIPMVDGAVPIVVDASVLDGAVLTVVQDAGVIAADGAAPAADASFATQADP